MTKQKISFVELLRKHSYTIPTTEEEVEAFENKYKSSYESPKEWSTIEEIIKLKDSVVKKIPANVDKNSAIESLSMAAREGKEITDVIKNKMKADRNASKK